MAAVAVPVAAALVARARGWDCASAVECAADVRTFVGAALSAGVAAITARGGAAACAARDAVRAGAAAVHDKLAVDGVQLDLSNASVVDA